MSRNHLAKALLAGAGAFTLTTGAAVASPTAEISSASRSGNSAQVAGKALFPAITEPQSVVGAGAARTNGAVAGTPAGEAAGLDLRDATIQPLANGTGLRFRWVVGSLPEQVPPEGVRYNWAFAIGGRVFQLQAKRTNMANATTVEDPVGHVQHAASGREFFQLRGACSAAYLGTPINGCYHLAFLQGAFDPAAKTIRIDLPYETRDTIGRLVAPEFKPGATLVDNGGEGSAGMTVAASFQAAVSNTYVSRYINGINPFYAGPRVQLGVAPASAFPASVTYGPAVALAPDGSYSGTVSGLTQTADTVYARACNGTQCGYAQLTLP